MTGSLGTETDSPKSATTKIRILRAIDRVLHDTLNCRNAGIVAQLCFSISRELANSSSGRFCDVNPAGFRHTPADCESCVIAARESGPGNGTCEEGDVTQDSCFTSMLKGKCAVSNCTMPCFTLYKDLVLNIIDGLAYHKIIRDRHGNAVDLEFTDVNPAFEKITGISRETAAGRKITEFLPGIKEDPFDWIGFYDQVAQSGKAVTIEQYSHALSRWYQVHLTPKDEDHLIAIFFDVTKLKESEQMLKSLNEQLELSIEEKAQQLKTINNELDSFAYSISHDLRAPLRAVNGFSRALMESFSDKLDEKGQHYLERIRLGASRMGELIDDLLGLSRISRRSLKRRKMDLGILAQGIINELKRRDPERCVELLIAGNLEVYTDMKLMRIALTNLLDNAWKFTSLKQTAIIEVSSTIDKEGRIFVVKDNGIGFDMQYSDRVFAPFQKLHSRNEFEGTGIGLAIVQRIINRHGGRIWVQSSPDECTAFYFTLKNGGEVIVSDE
ncbi:MAG: PAS domain S-box protein [Candidatus Thorarchaeota archaeon]|nr:PAS domain S-box protein [Candidatus Thorarchaeota archaeon]